MFILDLLVKAIGYGCLIFKDIESTRIPTM